MKTWALDRKADTFSEPERALTVRFCKRKKDISEMGSCKERGKEKGISQWVTTLRSDLGGNELGRYSK